MTLRIKFESNYVHFLKCSGHYFNYIFDASVGVLHYYFAVSFYWKNFTDQF